MASRCGRPPARGKGFAASRGQRRPRSPGLVGLGRQRIGEGGREAGRWDLSKAGRVPASRDASPCRDPAGPAGGFLKGKIWVGARPPASGGTSSRGLSRVLGWGCRGAGVCSALRGGGKTSPEGGSLPPAARGFWQSPAAGLGPRAAIASQVSLPFPHLPARPGLVHVVAPPPPLRLPPGARPGVGQVPHRGGCEHGIGATNSPPPRSRAAAPVRGRRGRFSSPVHSPRFRAACPPRRRRGISQPSPDRIKEKYTIKLPLSEERSRFLLFPLKYSSRSVARRLSQDGTVRADGLRPPLPGAPPALGAAGARAVPHGRQGGGLRPGGEDEPPDGHIQLHRGDVQLHGGEVLGVLRPPDEERDGAAAVRVEGHQQALQLAAVVPGGLRRRAQVRLPQRAGRAVHLPEPLPLLPELLGGQPGLRPPRGRAAGHDHRPHLPHPLPRHRRHLAQQGRQGAALGAPPPPPKTGRGEPAAPPPPCSVPGCSRTGERVRVGAAPRGPALRRGAVASPTLPVPP